MTRERRKLLSVFVVAVLFTAVFSFLFWVVEGSTRNLARVAIVSFPSGLIFGIIYAAVAFRKRA